MGLLLHFSDLDRRRRRALKTLRELADETGLTIAIVWNIFHGKCPDVRKIVAVCKALGVSPKRLDWESFVQKPNAGGRPDGNDRQHGAQEPELGMVADPHGQQ